MSRLLGLWLFLLPLAGTADGLVSLELDPEVQQGRLSNGIGYYLRPNREPENRLELRLIVRAGSVLEADDQLGLAHYVEHMAFNGTRNFAKQELVDYLEFLGMAFGPDLNAYTSFDETVYQLQVPTDDANVMRTAVEILRDWADGVSFDDEEIEKERGVVIEEWRSRRGAQQRILDQHLAVFFENSRYAQRMPIGTLESLETFSFERLRDFYRSWYRPDLMSIIAVGDADMEEIKDLIHGVFGDMKPIPDVAARIPTPVPAHENLLVSVVDDEEATQSTFSLYFKSDPVPIRMESDYRGQLVQQLLVYMLNQRFDELRRKPDPPFLRAFAFKGRFVHSTEVFGLGAHVEDNGLERGLETVLTEVERVRRHGFVQSEFERAKKDKLRSVEVAYNEQDTTESRVHTQDLLNHILHQDVHPGVEEDLGLHRALLPGIALEELNEQVQTWITSSNRVLLVSGPRKSEVILPAEKDLHALVGSVAEREVMAYHDDVLGGALIPDLPAGGSVVSRSRIEDLDVDRWTLSNGIRMTLKKTDFKEDEVLFAAFSPGGTSRVSLDDHVPAQSTASVVQGGGLGRFSLVHLNKKLAGQVVSLAPYLQELQEGLSGSCSPRDLETFFQLIHLWFTAPRKDQTAFYSFCQRTRAALGNRLADPNAVFSDMMRTVMSRGHPRHKPWTPHTVDSFDLQRSMDIFQQRFADADDFHFFFVGAYDPVFLEELAGRYLGALPVIEGGETWTDHDIDPPEGKIEHTVSEGLDAKGRVVIKVHGPMDWSFGTRHALQSMLAALNIRLRESLREDLGGTYSAGASPTIRHYPESRYVISIGFGCAPGQIDSLIAEVDRQIARLRNEPLDEKTLEKVKQMQLRQREVALKTNDFWLYVLKFYAWHMEDSRQLLDFPIAVEGLTGEAIQSAANTYFGVDNRAVFRLVPEAFAVDVEEGSVP